jgi:hypothetical protein
VDGVSLGLPEDWGGLEGSEGVDGVSLGFEGSDAGADTDADGSP